MARIAGRKVTDSATDVNTTMRPPSPTDRVSTIGTIISAATPTITVPPEVSTVCAAVRIVRSAAARRSAPASSSSRKRVTTSSE